MKFIKFQIFLFSILSICSLNLKTKNTNESDNAALTNAVIEGKNTVQSGISRVAPANHDISILKNVVANLGNSPNQNIPPVRVEEPFMNSIENENNQTDNALSNEASQRNPSKRKSNEATNSNADVNQSTGSGSFNFNVMIGNSNATISNHNVKGI